MKKILLVLAVYIFFASNVSFSTEGYIFTANDVQKIPIYSQSLQYKNLPYGEYLKFYNIHPAKIDAEFVFMSSNEEKKFLKTLSKSEKDNYEYAKKVQKLIQKRDWNKVFTKYPNYFPAYLQYYDYCYAGRNYSEAIRILKKIKDMDKSSKVFDLKLINHSFGILYFSINQYNVALNYFKMYENEGDDFILSSIANCYYAIGSYSDAIRYSKRLSQIQYQDKELLYSSYLALKNNEEANKYAKELLKENYCFDNLLKVQYTSQQDSAKLNYAYKARQVASSDEETLEANMIIADLEQKNLENSISKLNYFVKVPKWLDYQKQLPQNVSVAELTEKQNEFFTTANSYLKKYQGQQLTNAFNSLAQEYNTYVQNKRNQFYQEQQLEAQKALVIEQQRNNALQQQRNYIESQRIYYLTRPYYVPHRYYGWGW